MEKTKRCRTLLLEKRLHIPQTSANLENTGIFHWYQKQQVAIIKHYSVGLLAEHIHAAEDLVHWYVGGRHCQCQTMPVLVTPSEQMSFCHSC